jgi:hypothetical protein
MDLKDILTEGRVPFRTPGEHHHTTQGWVQVDCPDCSPGSQKWRLGLSLTKRGANCWTCGRKKFFPIMKTLLNVNGKVLFDLLGGIDFKVAKELRKTGTYKEPPSLGKLWKAHTAYLRHRGFDPKKLVRLWDLQGIAQSSRLAWRIFIPITLQGQNVSWTTRSISDKVDKRYIAASVEEEAISHKELLYGEEYCRHAVIVHEGPFDVFRTGPGAVCTFGTGFSRPQVLRLSKFPVRVVCYDSTADGKKASDDLCSQLEGFDGDTYQVFLKAKDAGSASRTEISKLRNRFLGG